MDYHSIHRELQSNSGVREPTRSTSLAAANSMVDNSNPSVSTAMQVVDSLSDIGRAMPFVAPAFILLKIIIDIEQRAQEVDAKCSDLVERITFMISHLPILEKIEIMPSTRQVIERMNEAIKSAAALIAAYRKQSRVARRLSISNREKFTQCAEAINICCHDLLMSLQIHQSTQLEILTRDVPIDDDDKAAQTFVEEHGGSVDAVMYDRELVKEFAQQQHLVMDDSVMEQLNQNIADSVQQNQQRFEGILQDNVKTAIADSLKSIAAEMHASEAEQRFKCVQCDKEFTNSSNGPKACSYHRAEYDSWSRSFPCCSTSHPCQFAAHRSKHHCDYPYGNFFPRSRGVLNYTDTNEEWASVEDTNLETDEVQKASVGQLYRWVSRGARVEENTLITVGRVWYKYPYYFNTFTAKELEDITKSVRLSRRTLIFRTSADENEYALAEWILSISGKITGVRLTAKAATSPQPYVRVCPIDLASCTRSGEILTLSEGGMRSYTPATPYALPSTVRIGPELSDEPARAVRTNFKTRTSTPGLRVVLKAASDPPLDPNPNLASTQVDYFQGKVSVFNNHPAGSLNPITIAAASASYRMVGDPDYLPAEACKIIDGTALPLSVDPRQAFQLAFEVSVPRTPEDAKREIRWWNRAYVNRKRPVRIKLTLEDIEGETCSLVFEHVFKPFRLEKQHTERDIGFFFFDQPDTLDRCYVHVEKVEGESSGTVIKIGSNEINVKRLNKVVYQALKTGKTEVDLEIGQEKNDGEWEWAAYALVDISCRRVYAFKVIVQQGKKVSVRQFGCLGYVECPSYGDVLGKTRPISYATESVRLHPLQPYNPPEYVQDDTLDDFKPPVPPKPATPVTEVPPAQANGANGGIPVDVSNRLASIDINLARIADALEKLVAVLPQAARQ